MKRVLCKILFPTFLISLWMITCYPVCQKEEGFDMFLYWILVGCPFGIHRMCLWIVPTNFGISGSVGVVALNCIIGGLIGSFVLIIRFGKIFVQILLSIITGYFGTSYSKK